MACVVRVGWPSVRAPRCFSFAGGSYSLSLHGLVRNALLAACLAPCARSRLRVLARMRGSGLLAWLGRSPIRNQRLTAEARSRNRAARVWRRFMDR